MTRILISLIKIYQKIPFSSHNACRFTPTCSNYAIEALEEYGFFKGSYLSIKRIMRCHPFGKSGFDPVPIRRKYEKEN